MTAPRRVVVVGGGPAGALTAAHVARLAPTDTVPWEIVIIDPAGASRWVRGTAYSTSDPRHLLNSAAGRMSVVTDRPDDFVQWARAHGAEAANGGSFLPRSLFGDYLVSRLEEMQLRAPAVVRRRRARVVGLDAVEPGLMVRLDVGRRLAADVVLLATGLPASSTAWVPEALRTSRAFAPDPWAPGALALGPGSAKRPPKVLLVGTGLTMVDVALSLTGSTGRPDVVIRAVSHKGRLPAVHAAVPAPPVAPDTSRWGTTLHDLREHVIDHLRRTSEETGDWRAGMDGLRSCTTDLWARMTETDRLRFLREDAADWARLRHRIPKASAVSIAALQQAGRLTIAAATVAGAEQLRTGAVRIVLSDGTVEEFDRVVNCTGPAHDLRRSGDSLVADLLRTRPGGALATVATGGLGFRLTKDGRLRRRGRPLPVWTVGALRRGEEWESTAMPEIIGHARTVGESMSAWLGERRLPAAPRSERGDLDPAAARG